MQRDHQRGQWVCPLHPMHLHVCHAIVPTWFKLWGAWCLHQGLICLCIVPITRLAWWRFLWMFSRSAASSIVHQCTRQLLTHLAILHTGTQAPETLTHGVFCWKAPDCLRQEGAEPCRGCPEEGRQPRGWQGSAQPSGGSSVEALSSVNRCCACCDRQEARMVPWADRSEVCSLQASTTGTARHAVVELMPASLCSCR